MLHAVIMAGGSGTRFWPLSRAAWPKQFLNLYGERSLLQLAYDRIVDLVGNDRLLLVTNCQQVSGSRQQLPDLPQDAIVGEPQGRDTAPCIALAAALLARQDPDAHMIVLAADHLIQPTAAFHRAARAADDYVRQHPETLVTFGIVPSHASTAYGYLRANPAGTTTNDEAAVFPLLSFHEKPQRDVAETFVKTGGYYWNSGIFCWRARTIIEEIQRHAPVISQAVERIADAWNTTRREEVFTQEYQNIPKISIDYAVMEKASSIAMVTAHFQWDDVGSWLALERVLPADEHQNVARALHHGINTNHCIIFGNDQHLITTLGVKNLIIVHTPDATLVADRANEQAVKDLLQVLRSRGLENYL